MSDKRHLVDVCIVMNEEGHYVVACDEETASEKAKHDELCDAACRYVHLKITLAPPDDETIAAKTFTLSLD